VQPKPEDYDYDLDRALGAIVGVRTTIPGDAFTAETLGTERTGHGVIIRNDGLVLTIGYLVTEAETVWLTLAGGGVVPGHVLGYDQETGFGLVQALAHIDVPALTLGDSAKSKVGDHVVVAGAGGRRNAVAARIVAKQEFAGYWEYLLDEAIFTSPSHPHWGGTGLICPAGKLIGIGSLQVQQGGGEGGSSQQTPTDINMIVPIDLLKPVLEDLTTIGRPSKSPRPWLGVFAAEVGDRIVIAGMSRRGPASKSSLKVGDIVMSVAGQDVRGLPTFFRNVWAIGPAGASVPLTINRNGRTMDVTVQSGDRRSFLRGPVLH
jgi:S1-C subfamily serine protease